MTHTEYRNIIKELADISEEDSTIRDVVDSSEYAIYRKYRFSILEHTDYNFDMHVIEETAYFHIGIRDVVFESLVYDVTQYTLINNGE